MALCIPVVNESVTMLKLQSHWSTQIPRISLFSLAHGRWRSHPDQPAQAVHPQYYAIRSIRILELKALNFSITYDSIGYIISVQIITKFVIIIMCMQVMKNFLDL